MKIKAFISVMLCLATMLLFACTPDNADGNASQASEEYYIDGAAVNPMQIGTARLNTEDGLSMEITFGLPVTIYTKLTSEFNDLQMVGYYGRFDGEKQSLSSLVKTDAVYVGSTVWENLQMRLYTVSVPVGGVEDALTEYTVQARLVFSGGEYSVPPLDGAAVCSPYKAALWDLADVSESETEDYPYLNDEGYFSRLEDASTHKRLLYSALDLSLEGGVITDLVSELGFEPYYDYSWFDGILTVEAKNGEINGNILRTVRVNGREMLFEVRDGIVRIVIEEGEQ